MSAINLLDPATTLVGTLMLAEVLESGVYRSRKVDGALLKGEQGEQGIQGEQGEQGEQGIQGEQGEKGDTGDTGPAGPIAGSDTQVAFNDGGVAAGNANLTFDKTSGVLSSKNIKLSVGTLSYAASVALDFLAEGFQTVTLSGDIEFTTSNRAIGRSLAVRIVADGSIRTFTFPAWVFVGSEPADIAANKTGVLSLTCFGANDSDIVAAYAVEA